MKTLMKRQTSGLFVVAAILLFVVSPVWAVKDVKFAVFSDAHLYDASLGTKGAAFEAYLIQDRKLLRESEAILDATIKAILEDDAIQFVIIPGDLTKDGEKKCHHLFAKKLAEIEKAGKEVYVIPGNHDINNPHASRYRADHAIPVPYVSPKKFKTIYKDFGYKEALYQDPNSLSYVAEPVRGLWLIAMDSCSYDNNLTEGQPTTSGEFKPETFQWILRMIAKGQKKGKRMIGMMHHGVTEHYTMQSVLFSDYVVKDWPIVSQAFANAGLNVVFTGHYHASDATIREFPGGTFIIDVETGSLVTYPNPYRKVTLTSDNVMEITTQFIDEIDYDTGGLPFPEYAETFLKQGLTGIVYYTLRTEYGLPDGEPTLTFAVQLTDAFMAHYAGDELPSLETLELISWYLGFPPTDIRSLMGRYLYVLWTDLMPFDRSISIDLN